MNEPANPTRNRSFVYGGLALLLAGGTAGGVWKVAANYDRALDEARHPVDTVEVLVTTREINAGGLVTPDDLDVVRMPASEARAGRVFSDRKDVIGETAVERILAGEPIRRERLTLGGGTPRPETILEDGTRAVTVKVDRAAGVGGLVSPGSYVDVIVTIKPDENSMNANWVTETVMQAVRVLAVGESMVTTPNQAEKPEGPTPTKEKTSNRPRDVFATLEVEPDEAEKLAMATARGEIYLSLRPRNDFTITLNETPLVTNVLVGLGSAPSPRRASRLEKMREATTTPTLANIGDPHTEVISGGDMKVEHFDVNTGRLVVPQGRK